MDRTQIISRNNPHAVIYCTSIHTLLVHNILESVHFLYITPWMIEHQAIYVRFAYCGKILNVICDFSNQTSIRIVVKIMRLGIVQGAHRKADLKGL